MLTLGKIAAGPPSAVAALTAHFLEKTLGDDEVAIAEYYARGPIGPRVQADITSKVAAVLGIKPGQVLNRDQLAFILSGRRADGRKFKGRKRPKSYRTKGGQERHAISAIDFCLSAPKSVSLAWMAAKSDAERNSILHCHRTANRLAMAYIEQDIAKAVMGAGTEKAKLGWITIDHFTSRPTVTITRPDPKTGVTGTEIYTVDNHIPGDPNLHSHNIVPNVMVTESGRHVAMNQHWLMGRRNMFGAVYQAFLGQELRNIGIEVELCDKHLLAKIPCIPQEVCDAFSKRTTGAEEAARRAARERSMDWDTMDAGERVRFLKGGAKATKHGKGDDLADFKAWNRQAEELGWEHDTAIAGPQPLAPDYVQRARDTALSSLEEELKGRAVVDGHDITLQAARGAIAHGMKDVSDLKRVTTLMAHEGVIQDGEDTNLEWLDTEKGIKVTTRLHRAQEAELIDLVREAAGDMSGALSLAEVTKARFNIAADYDTEIGKLQASLVDKVAVGGRFAVFIGVGGAGKTKAILPPIVKAYQERGCTVWGVSQGWKQADELREAGIGGFNIRALQHFLNGVEKGGTNVSADDVVMLDEISQIGTRDFLRLMRLRKIHGFKIVCTGDPKQCQSVSAGAIIELLQRALPQSILEILSSVRQKIQRERDIAGMFRDGKAREAIGKKIKDGSAVLVEGGYDDAVREIARLAVENDATVSAPTNADALAIGRVMRDLRGVGPSLHTGTFSDNTGASYSLDLAKGDRVRLFERIRDHLGRIIGSNGSVLTVENADAERITLITENNKKGFVPWRRIGGRLAYGDCLTIDSAQGMTSDRHIFAMPGGSRNVNGFKAYVASSRHKIASWIVTSKGMEMQGLKDKRPLGVNTPMTDDVLWDQVAVNLSRQPVKETALSVFGEFVRNEKDKAVLRFQQGMRSAEKGTAMKRKAHRGAFKPTVAPRMQGLTMAL